MRRLVVLLALAFLSACNGAGPVAPREPLPTRVEMVTAHNARTALLQRMWSRATVRFSAMDSKGRRRTEQGDGYLQVVQPDRVSLSVGSYVDRMYFYLGCNPEFYWWLDTMKDDAKIGLVGRTVLASRERSAELGVPVHPLDLLELLAVSPLPEDGNPPEWSADGQAIVVDAPARWGSRHIYFNPVTRDPVRVDLIADDGTLSARAEHALHIAVRVEGSGIHPSIGGRITIDLPVLEAQVILDLKDPESAKARPKPQTFDLDVLLRATRITDVRSLDEPS